MEGQKIALAGLPDDPLGEILSRVPVKEVHRSKCVSKGWRDLIDGLLHRKKLPQTLQGFFPSYAGESVNEFVGSFINLLGGSPPPVDPSFPILKNLPGIHKIRLRGSCNGLFLFNHSTGRRQLGYIVFNPATEQWAAVPSERTNHNRRCRTYLVFDPAVSSHFNLVLFCAAEDRSLAIFHTYSSETGVWRHSQIDWAGHWARSDPQISTEFLGAAFFNGVLHLILNDNQIAVVDVEGKTRRIIPALSSVGRQSARNRPIFIGHSQGRLHCITDELVADDIPSELSSRVYIRDFDDDCDLLSIWVLEDYDAPKWVLKHSVSRMRLFGRKFCIYGHDFDVVTIHPDSNLVFIFLYWNRELVSYGLDSMEVRALGKLGQNLLWFTPYVPCFLDFLSVADHDDLTRQSRRALPKSDVVYSLRSLFL